jgi:glucose-6-phosphate 1-dehydrogenase
MRHPVYAISLRNCNSPCVLPTVWNKDHIANVRITLEEDFGAEGRGGYFDEVPIFVPSRRPELASMRPSC